MKALVGELVFSFQFGNHRVFQPHAEEKKPNQKPNQATKTRNKWVSALNLIANTSPARNKRLERKEISNPNDSSLPLLTIYFIFLHQMLWKRNSNV